MPATISASGTSTGSSRTTSGRWRLGDSAAATEIPSTPSSPAASSLSGFQVRRISSPCSSTATTIDSTPTTSPAASIVPSPTPSDPLTASTPAPGSTISSPTSRPMASAPPTRATLTPVRAATERAIGASITSATSK